LVESLINRDTSIVHSSKINPVIEEFADELAHIAPIPSGIVEANFNQNDDTSSDDDDFEDIEYVSLYEVDQEEKEFDLEDILQIQDVILREKLLNVSRLISNIESLKDNPIPVMDSDFTTTHANYSLPEYESFHCDNPSLPQPPPEPPNVCLDMLYNDESFEPGEGSNQQISEASRVWLICPVQLELLILCAKLVWGDPISFHHYRFTFAYLINGLDFHRDPTLNIEDNVSF
ncbi:hypothetical protein Tco_1373115, partial [Tanacetum coccineum]